MWGTPGSPAVRGAAAAALLAALVLASAPATAHAQALVGQGTQPVHLGASLGGAFALGGGDYPVHGVRLRLDGLLEGKPLAPRVGLSWLLSLGLTFGGRTDTLEAGVPGFAAFRYTLEQSLAAWDVAPGMRLSYEAAPRLSFYSDLALGLAIGRGRADVRMEGDSTFPAMEVSVQPTTGSSALLRLGLGASWAATPRVALGAELMGLTFSLASGDATYGLLVGATFRL